MFSECESSDLADVTVLEDIFKCFQLLGLKKIEYGFIFAKEGWEDSSSCSTKYHYLDRVAWAPAAAFLARNRANLFALRSASRCWTRPCSISISMLCSSTALRRLT
jgi:hypothetical protein